MSEKKATKHRCCIVDNRMQQCKKMDATLELYHGNNVIYPEVIDWVKVWICSKHKEYLPKRLKD